MRRLCILVVVGVAVCTSAQRVRAESVTYSEFVTLQPTGWTQNVVLPQFDPAMGALNSAILTLAGHIEGSAAFENMDTGQADVSLLFAAEMTLSGATLASVLVVSPELNLQSLVDPFDGAIDFGGVSGRSFVDLVAEAVLTIDLLDGFSSAALYTGTDTITFVAQSSGGSFGSGSGNLLLNFQQSSSALVEIAYGYSVPEPGMLGLLGLALLIASRRRPIIRSTW